MRIALAQLNPTVGAIRANADLVLEAVRQAQADGADALVVPELALIGYPARDVLYRDGVVQSCEDQVQRIADACGALTVFVGHPRIGPQTTGRLRNSVSACRGGEVIGVYDKRLLPGYDVFDEDRWFEPGADTCVVDVAGKRIGVLVCEDMWEAQDAGAARRYPVSPVAETVAAGADVLVVLNASPYKCGKPALHEELVRSIARKTGCPMIAVNQVGANDDLVFDGRALAVNGKGEHLASLTAWSPDYVVADLDAAAAPVDDLPDEMDDQIRALELAVRDYCGKTGNNRVIIGLSGGIDSALTAVIAGMAIGAENIVGVLMPSRYSSDHSRSDADELIDRMRIGERHELSIEAMHAATTDVMLHAVGESASGVADENAQARLRGLLLMGISNATGGLVLATGNKSEFAVGYSTLYGDMCGAVAVIGDLLKTDVYRMSRYINTHHKRYGFDTPPIPEGTITKPPSAELRPDQVDQDSLPEYDVLDAIIRGLVEEERSVEAIAADLGQDVEFVLRWAQAIDRSQFKRDQAAVIPKVSARTFGRGRPMPLVARIQYRS